MYIDKNGIQALIKVHCLEVLEVDKIRKTRFLINREWK